MRAAHIKDDGTVINYVEVNEFSHEFVDPVGSVLGSIWDGSAFNPPHIPPTVRTRQEIISELEALDLKSIRPIREGDVVRIATIEEKMASLRIELQDAS